MATVIINGSDEHQVEIGEYDSVYDLLMTAQEKLWDVNHLISELRINGERVDPIEEAALKAIPGADTKVEITLTRTDERSLADTLGEADAYLQKLETGFEEVSNKIRNESNAEAYKMLGEGINGLMTILDLFDYLQGRAGIDEELGQEFKTFIGELNEKSQELNDAQESQDPTLIADILEYEFVESIQELRTYLTRFQEAVG